MINPRKLSCLLIVVLLAISGCASFVRAQTVQTHPFKDDFGDRAEINPAGVNVFAYDISQNEQNEPDGGWISGNSYQVNWTIRLDYVNQDMISGKSYILFYLPSPLDVEFPNANVAKQIITNQTILSPTNKSGSLSATFSPGNLTSYFFSLKLQFAVYINGALYTAPLRTDAGQEATFSEEISNGGTQPAIIAQAPEFPMQLSILALLIAAFASATLTVALRKRKIASSWLC